MTLMIEDERNLSKSTKRKAPFFSPLYISSHSTKYDNWRQLRIKIPSEERQMEYVDKTEAKKKSSTKTCYRIKRQPTSDTIKKQL